MKYLAMIATMMLPVVASAQDSVGEKLLGAERSPLFQQKFPSDQISARGLDRIPLHDGVELQFRKYTELTRLDEHEKFQPLMDPALVNQYMRAKPSYTENVLQLQDRLIVVRTMKVSMKKGTCQQQNLPVSVKELCFVESTGAIPAETRDYLGNLRLQLDQAEPNTRVKDGITARQLGTMDDEQLLEVLLNSDDREIKLVSVLPTEVYGAVTPLDLWDISKRLKASDFNTAKSASIPANAALVQTTLRHQRNAGNRVFPTHYFLTGFTLGREITDTFEIQLAAATLFTDRYFVRFEYEFSTGLGLRFPFSVSVESQASTEFGRTPLTQGGVLKATSTGTSQPSTSVPARALTGSRAARSTATDNTVRDHRTPGVTSSRATAGSTGKRSIRDHRTAAVDPAQVVAGENTPTTDANPVTHADMRISVAPVNVETNGSPAYPAVNLPQSKYFDGREFVLKFKAGCKFTASIPGDDVNLDCPSVGFDKSRDIDPVIGEERANLTTLWLNGAVTGLSIQAWVGKASLDFGIACNLTNGSISFNANGFNNTLIDSQSTHSFSFQDRKTQQFKVANTDNKNAAFSLDTPRYGFDLELLPVARARFNLDLGVRTLNKTLGPYSLDALSMTVAGFSMGHHEGTVSSHVYGL